jgi:replication-associated recombination protein RarA
MREEKGMKEVPVSLHLVFLGNPGTGKTTVARILAKLYKEIGILETGQLVETDRSGLVAGYVGQTAIKTQKKIEEAMGGVLFIDEAYMLNQEGENYGQEAIDTILKAMEDHRDKFIVIVAGYTDLMKDFVESNPGLKSRFNKYFEFKDYTVDELQQIFEMQCRKYQYKLTDEADAAVKEEIVKLEKAKGENFANAREVRNLFEKIITNQAARISELDNIDEETLMTVTMEDLKDLDDLTLKEGEREIRRKAIEDLLTNLAESAVDMESQDTKEDKPKKAPKKKKTAKQ